MKEFFFFFLLRGSTQVEGSSLFYCHLFKKKTKHLLFYTRIEPINNVVIVPGA